MLLFSSFHLSPRHCFPPLPLKSPESSYGGLQEEINVYAFGGIQMLPSAVLQFFCITLSVFNTLIIDTLLLPITVTDVV